MLTVGLLPSQELISLEQNTTGEWLNVPEGQQVVPLVKLAQPAITRTQKAEPVLQWFSDRVERQWQVTELEGQGLGEALRKVWPHVQAFMAEFTMGELAAISLSVDPTIAALRMVLMTWLGEVHSDDPRVSTGLARLVELGIITEPRKQTILS